MKQTQRHDAIVELVKKQGYVSTEELVEQFAVSPQTIRRDLNSEPGPVVLLGGYVVLEPRSVTANHYLLSDQKTRRIDEKRHAARLAAAMVRPHQTVFFDCGTTSPFVIDFIPDELEFTAVCSSLNVLLKLQNKPNCHIVLCGGTFHRKNQVFESSAESGILDSVRLTWAFVTAAGVSQAFGVTCFNFNEVEVKQKVLRQAQQRVLLADFSKFDTVRTAHFASLEDFQYVVSDKKIPRAYKEAIQASGAQLLV